MTGEPITILLTGINGQVGHSLLQPLSMLGNVVAMDRRQLDLSDPDAIRRVIRETRPALIINPAAYTAVDRAESEPDLAFAINAKAPEIMAQEAARLGAKLVHYSTDYVFDGQKQAPYLEYDATNPLSVYGRTKLAGEEAIRAVGLPHLILRTSWVYGPYGKNFMKTMIRLATERESLRVVADQFGTPTSSLSIAEATVAAISSWSDDASGTYHMTNAGDTTWYGFAQAILENYEVMYASRGWPELKVNAEAIAAITTTEYPMPAARPANSRLDCSKFRQVFGWSPPDWQEALEVAMRGLAAEGWSA